MPGSIKFTTQSGLPSSSRKDTGLSMFKLPEAYSVPSMSSSDNQTDKIKEMEQRCVEADQTIFMLQNSMSEKERLLNAAQANCDCRLNENMRLAQKLSEAMRSVKELELDLRNAQASSCTDQEYPPNICTNTPAVKRTRADSDEKEYVLFSSNDKDISSGLIDIHDLPQEVLLLVINKLLKNDKEHIKIEIDGNKCIEIDQVFDEDEFFMLKFFEKDRNIFNGNVDLIKKNINNKLEEFKKFKNDNMHTYERKDGFIEDIVDEKCDPITDILIEFAHNPKIDTVPFPSNVKIVGQIVVYMGE